MIYKQDTGDICNLADNHGGGFKRINASQSSSELVFENISTVGSVRLLQDQEEELLNERKELTSELFRIQGKIGLEKQRSIPRWMKMFRREIRQVCEGVENRQVCEGGARPTSTRRSIGDHKTPMFINDNTTVDKKKPSMLRALASRGTLVQQKYEWSDLIKTGNETSLGAKISRKAMQKAKIRRSTELGKMVNSILRKFSNTRMANSALSSTSMEGDAESAIFETFDKCRYIWDAAIYLNPSLSINFYNRGKCNLVLGLYQDAVKDLTDAINLEVASVKNDSKSPEAATQTEMLHPALGDVAANIVAPAKYYATRAFAYRNLGNDSQAFSDYSLCLLAPTLPNFGGNSIGFIPPNIDPAITLEGISSHHQAQAYFNRAMVCLDKHNHEGAIADLSAALERKQCLTNSSIFNCLLHRGICHRLSNNLAASEADLRMAVDMFPGEADARNHLGLTLLSMKQYINAQSCFKSSVDLRPQCPGDVNNLGLSKFYLGLYDEAIADYTLAIELSDLKVSLVNIDEGTKLFDLVSNCYKPKVQNSKRLPPIDPRIFFNRANAYIENPPRGKYIPKALGDYEMAIQLDPSNVEYMYCKGMAYQASFATRENLEFAMRAYKMALQVDPHHRPSKFNLGIVQHASGNVEAALSTFIDVETLTTDYDEDMVNLYFYLGLVHRDEGLFDEALANFERAIEITTTKRQTSSSKIAKSTTATRRNKSLSRKQSRIPTLVGSRKTPLVIPLPPTKPRTVEENEDRRDETILCPLLYFNRGLVYLKMSEGILDDEDPAFKNRLAIRDFDLSIKQRAEARRRKRETHPDSGDAVQQIAEDKKIKIEPEDKKIKIEPEDKKIKIELEDKKIKIELEENDEGCVILNFKGIAWQRCGNHLQALMDFSNAISISERLFEENKKSNTRLVAFVEYLANRQACFQEQGVYELAEKDLTRAIEIFTFNLKENSTNPPNSILNSSLIERQMISSTSLNLSQLFKTRGLVCYFQKNYKGAICDFETALSFGEIRDNNELADLYYQLGICLVCLTKYAAGVDAFNSGIKHLISHNDCFESSFKPHFFHERAKALQLCNKHEEAIRDFSIVLTSQPTNSRALFRRAFSYKALKLYEEAAEDFEAAKEFEPSDPRLVLDYRKINPMSSLELGPSGHEDIIYDFDI